MERAALYCVSSEGVREGEGGWRGRLRVGGCLPSGSHPAGQWQTHSTGNTVALWPPSVLVEVGILPANKGINPQGILGIFTFGNGEEVVVGGQRKTICSVLSELFRITF